MVKQPAKTSAGFQDSERGLLLTHLSHFKCETKRHIRLFGELFLDPLGLPLRIVVEFCLVHVGFYFALDCIAAEFAAVGGRRFAGFAFANRLK